MTYFHTAEAQVPVDEELVVAALSYGGSMSLGTICMEALNSWGDTDVRSLCEDTTQEEIRSVEIILRAMKGEEPWQAEQNKTET